MIFDSETNTYLKRAAWTTVVNNSIEYAYYPGVEAGNPSGNVENLKTETYKNNLGVEIFTIQYEYNLTDNITKESCLKIT